MAHIHLSFVESKNVPIKLAVTVCLFIKLAVTVCLQFVLLHCKLQLLVIGTARPDTDLSLIRTALPAGRRAF